MDNLSTHKPGALYEVFEPKEAKRIRDRFDFVYTPKHGSWLNMAEIELNVLMGQCLNRRIHLIEVMQKEVKAWQTQRNNKEAIINWQFTKEDPRIKLKRLYPTILDLQDTRNMFFLNQRTQTRPQWLSELFLLLRSDQFFSF